MNTLFTEYTDAEVSLLLEVGKIKRFSQYDDDQFVQLSKKIPIFKGLKESDIASMMLNPKFLRFSDRDLIIKNSTHSDEVYFLLSGEVSILDSAKEIKTLSQGNLFGVISSILREKMPFDIASKGDSVIFSFRANFKTQTEQQLFTHYLFHKNISKYLASMIKEIDSNSRYL